MTHFGIVCPATAGHLNPMMALGLELKQRGHNVTLFNVLDVRSYALAAGLNFCPIGETDFPIGTNAETNKRRGELSGLRAMKYSFALAKLEVEMSLRDCPKAIAAAAVDGLIIDQVSLWGGTVAEFLDLPFVSIANALPFNIENGIPPIFTNWSYSSGWLAYCRNKAAYKTITPLVKPTQKIIEDYRRKWNLPSYSFPNKAFSCLAQLSQQLAEFEFPRKELPSVFHFMGPFSSPASREPISFPYEKLTGQPLIYASLGTLQNQLFWIFQMIAEACVGLDAQLVISLGGGANTKSLPNFLGNPLVVSYAPQLELLQKSALCITHAGMNTTLETLSNGVPMVAIPITNDQPGIAARIAWTRTGKVVSLNGLSTKKLSKAIKQVLTEDDYKNNALKLQKIIKQAGGLEQAADIVEQAIVIKRPVTSNNNKKNINK